MESASSPDVTNYIILDLLLNKVSVVLRNVFRERWKSCTETEWVDSQKFGENFVSGLGSHVFKQAGRIQKRMLRTGDLNEWDLNTLTQVLTNINLGGGSKKIVKYQNRQIQQLSKVRNLVAHLPNKEISQEQFEELWKKVKDNLTSLGVSGNEIDELKERSPTRNTASVEAEKLKSEGNAFYTTNDVEKAIELYSKAISLEGLSHDELAILHSNRSRAYLKSSSSKLKIKDKRKYLALADAIRAKELKPTWWRAYQRVAQCHEALNKLEEAVKYYDKAVGLNPSISEVRTARDNCRYQLGKKSRLEHLDPLQYPKSLSEQMDTINETTGQKFNTKSFIEIENVMCQNGIPQGYVCRAHRYRDGIDAELNYEMAAKWYTKAASQGNAEAIYNLALLTKEGKGVRQNFEAAIKLLKQAAVLPPKLGAHPNTGVAEAQHALGLSYEEGIGVPINPSEAANWYKLSSENGCGSAANNLGILYAEGKNVPMNIPRAVQYWKLAASRKNALAMAALSKYYLEEDEPEQALVWHQRAITAGNMFAQMQSDDFEKQLRLKKIQRLSLESDILQWETEHKLTSKHMTFRERCVRKMQTDHPQETKNFEKLSKCFQQGSNIKLAYSKVHREFNPVIIQQYASAGSITAQRLSEAIMHFETAIMLMHNSDPVANKQRIIHELAQCFRTEHIVAQWSAEEKEYALGLVRGILNETENGGISQLDLDTRICYATIRIDYPDELKVFLRESIKKYPTKAELYYSYCCLFGFLQDFNSGLTETTKALQIFPQHCNLLYIRAAYMRCASNTKPQDVIEAYEKFLFEAVDDHRKVPEAFYCIALEYLRMDKEKGLFTGPRQSKRHSNQKNIEKFYGLGINAEGKQLPCFMPYSSNQKPMLESLMELFYDVVVTSPITSLSSSSSLQGSTITNNSVPTTRPNGKNLTHLTDPLRIELIVSHRENYTALKSTEKAMYTTQTPKQVQKIPSKLHGLKQIFLRDMDPTKDYVYEGSVIDLIVIEDANFGAPSVHLIVEDENGDIQRAFIYNVPQAPSTQETIGYGCKISILNPYLRLAVDKKPAIRVDDPQSIITVEKQKYRCRFCGDEKATFGCSRCKKASYCSRECQEMDWRKLKHKLICEPVSILLPQQTYDSKAEKVRTEPKELLVNAALNEFTSSAPSDILNIGFRVDDNKSASDSDTETNESDGDIESVWEESEDENVCSEQDKESYGNGYRHREVDYEQNANNDRIRQSIRNSKQFRLFKLFVAILGVLSASYILSRYVWVIVGCIILCKLTMQQ